MSAAKKTNAEPGVHEIARAAFKKELLDNGWSVLDEGNELADRSYNGLHFYLTDLVTHPSKFEVKLRCERENLPQRLRPVVVPFGDRAPRKPRNYGIRDAEQEATYRKAWQEFGTKLARSVHRQLEIIDAQTRVELQRAEKEKARADSRAIVAAAGQQKLQTQLEAVGVNPKYAALVHSGMDVQLPGGVTLRLSSTVRDWTDAPLTVDYTIDMNTHDTNQQGIVDFLRFLTVAGALEK